MMKLFKGWLLVRVIASLATAAVLGSCQASGVTLTSNPEGAKTIPATSSSQSTSETPQPTITPIITTLDLGSDVPPITAYTYQQLDGNRWLEGEGDLRNATCLDIDLPGPPSWLVAAPFQGGVLWVAVLENGAVHAFKVSESEIQPVPINPSNLTPGAPPLLLIQGDTPTLLTPPGSSASETTHPVWLAESSRMVYIEANGDLAFLQDGAITRLAVDALPDARILVDEQERLLLYSSPTDRYQHGVLGDSIEAGSVTLVTTRPQPAISLVIPFAPQVAEGIAPIWTDLDLDGAREIIVTVSDASQGAQIAIYNENGTQVATSEPIGNGYRWRHLLAAAPFGVGGGFELVDVITPHIGGIVEYLTLADNRLQTAAALDGYSTHRIGSRNLDMAIAGDFDADGTPELLLPNQAMDTLAIIKQTELGAIVVWSLPTDSRISSNLTGVYLDSEGLWIGAGLENSTLRIWHTAEK